MANRQNPNDPSTLSLSPSSAGGNKPDFSNVQSRTDTTVKTGSGGSGGTGGARPDFSNVRSHTDTVPNNSGGGGAGTQTYTVQKGDTLSEIAQRHYGKSSQWNAIFEANRDQLDDPDLIKPGQVLRLPSA